jgi:dephospho-CoA kinase
MSIENKKYVIGLTGNIATGKSEVRRMLEKLGAYGIDADRLTHAVIAKGEPAYTEILAEFGPSILNDDGQIDRARLGETVFSNETALLRLEAIVHPQVRHRVIFMAAQAQAPVVVIEAIKLIEAGFTEMCDTIWVTYAPIQVQLYRLMHGRGMTEALARQRIAAQPAQEDKLAVADVIIHNEGTLQETWEQVNLYWQNKVQPEIE